MLGQLGASGPAVPRMWLWLLGRIPPDLAPRDLGTSRGRSWFGKQLATGTCPRCSLSVSQEGWALTRGAAQGKRGHCPFPSPTAHRLWAHTMGLAPKNPTGPPPCFVPGAPISLTSVAGASLLQIPAGIFVLGSPDLGDF